MNTNKMFGFVIVILALTVPVFATVGEVIKLDFDRRGPLAMLVNTPRIQENFGPFNKANYLSALYDSRGVYYSPETVGTLIYPLYIKRDATPDWQASQAILDAENSQPTYILPATSKPVKVVIKSSSVEIPTPTKVDITEKITAEFPVDVMDELPEHQHAELSIVAGHKQFVPGKMTLVLNLDNIASLRQGEKGATVTGLIPGKFRLVSRTGSTLTEYTVTVLPVRASAGYGWWSIAISCLLAGLLGAAIASIFGWWYWNKAFHDEESQLVEREKNLDVREKQILPIEWAGRRISFLEMQRADQRCNLQRISRELRELLGPELEPAEPEIFSHPQPGDKVVQMPRHGGGGLEDMIKRVYGTKPG